MIAHPDILMTPPTFFAKLIVESLSKYYAYVVTLKITGVPGSLMTASYVTPQTNSKLSNFSASLDTLTNPVIR